MSGVLPAEGPAFGLVFSGMQSPAFKKCLWVGGVVAGIVLHGDLLIALASRALRHCPNRGGVAQVAFSCKEGCAYSEVKLF